MGPPEGRRMTKELPELSDQEVVQMIAAQKTLMEHHEQLGDEYREKIREMAEKYGVEVDL
jgi:hypothetical protein